MPYDLTEDDLEILMEDERIANICNEYMESLEEEILYYNQFFDD